MTDAKTATAYVQIAREKRSWSGEAVVRKVTNRKPEPEQILPGCVVVKIRIRVPVALWEPITPEAVIDVPAELVQRPVEVEAVEP
ncbi:MAG: hypothetical protein HOU01_18310 [Streptomycetaceae bacterium]|nr:hypothetical protein [Streptomycetaceae bacterium]